MIRMNENYNLLQGSYLFSEIARRVREFQAKNPGKDVIRLGIGDVTRPLVPAVIEGLHQGVEDMARAESFKGYGPEAGYEFLRDAIKAADFTSRMLPIESDEIFISTGAKEDTANFQELFAPDIRIAIPDPVYPVYVDSNVMAGRSGSFADGRYQNFVYMDATQQNNFSPELPSQDVDLIYLCYPNNPTGKVLSKKELARWVEYAHQHQALILFDAAYEAFIREDGIPHSIYEIDGAKVVAVEFRSLSKTAGFTGTRVAYTVIPKNVMVYDKAGEKHSLHQMWFRRQATKFNGVAYLIQKGAQQVFSAQGHHQVTAQVDYYLNNARIIREGLDSLGISYMGGINSPYVWLKVPGKINSWEFFDLLLNRIQVVGTPGSGFGRCGEGYFRLSSFNEVERVEEAVSRIKSLEL